MSAVECKRSVVTALTRMEKIVPGMTAGAWLGPFCVGWLLGAMGASARWIVREAKSPQLLCRYALQVTLPREICPSRPEST